MIMKDTDLLNFANDIIKYESVRRAAMAVVEEWEEGTIVLKGDHVNFGRPTMAVLCGRPTMAVLRDTLNRFNDDKGYDVFCDKDHEE